MSLSDLMTSDTGEIDDDFDALADGDESFWSAVKDSFEQTKGSQEGTSEVSFGLPYDIGDYDDDESDDAAGPSDEVLFSHEKYFSARLLELLKGSLSGGDPSSSTGLLSGVYPMLLHQTKSSPHPERPARMVAIYHEIISQGLDARCKLVPVRAAHEADLELVHTQAQVRESTCTYVSEVAASAALRIDSDTYFAADASGHAARLAAGSVVELVTRICHGELRYCGQARIAQVARHDCGC